MGDRQEHATKSGMISRKIISHYEDHEPVGSDVLHAPLHEISTQHKGFSDAYHCGPNQNEAGKGSIAGNRADMN
jgi:hypothetical protein